MPSTTMSALLESADKNRKPGSYWGGAIAHTPIGKVVCNRDYCVSGKRLGDKHARTTWKLDGKVISAAKLAAIFVDYE